jgi:uncharacterized protein (TIGR01777 family)
MKVLITGGTGLVGTRLSELLLAAGHEVALLSREPSTKGPYKTFVWAPADGTIDPAAVPFADVVVNLAGANVGEGRWTEARKTELAASRLDSLALLHRELAKPGHRVQAVLSASAIGYYGNTGDRLATEDAPPAQDFLAALAQRWEQAAEPIAALGIRLVTPRIGVVLSTKGGALVPLAATVKLGLGAPLGTGQQYLSWIHLDDLCHLFMAMLADDAWQGPYNAVAPYPATNEAFTEVLAEVLHRPLLLPKVPGFALKLLLGEQSEMVLAGQYVSAEKVMTQGFEFDYPVLRGALKELYSKE